MSSAVLSRTLRSLTDTKLHELSRSLDWYEAQKKECLDAADQAPTKTERVRQLLRGLAKIYNERIEQTEDESKQDSSDRFNVSVSGSLPKRRWRNMMQFLDQAESDDSIPKNMIEEWEKQALEDLDLGHVKHSHSVFYGKLVMDWIQDTHDETPVADHDSDDARGEQQEQQAKWEKLVFNEAEVDTDAIQTYLDKLFKSTTASRVALEKVQKQLARFGTNFLDDIEFDHQELQSAASSLLRASALPADKLILLKEITTNNSVASEIIDVLKMRMSRLSEWDWPRKEGVTMSSQRHLNGKYRMFMDEDILDSILMYHIGMTWCNEVKEEMLYFFDSPAWSKPMAKLSENERQRRKTFLDERKVPQIWQRNQTANFRDNYFMTQLPSTYDDGPQDYNGESDSEDLQMKSSAQEIKQSLLHQIIAEYHISKALDDDFAVIRSDFSWFGPSLPFGTIFQLLKFFGFPQQWLNLFDKFLHVPLKWGGEVKERKRGVPIDHILSDLFGELILFCMDFAVSQATKGKFMYRMHDDFWFWGKQKECSEAWKCMTEFASIMGLEFNQEKTGSVVMCGDTTNNDLPNGNVVWGFLKLDARQGRFIIDRSQVDEHIDELCRQLRACRSIFAWIRAWNGYFARFFSNNFGKPSNGFGRAHIDMMIETYSHIEKQVFKTLDSPATNVTQYLLDRINAEFEPNHRLPPGVLYLPIEKGGLGLKNPYISLFAQKGSVTKSPEKVVKQAFDQDEIDYERKKVVYHNGGFGTEPVSAPAPRVMLAKAVPLAAPTGQAPTGLSPASQGPTGLAPTGEEAGDSENAMDIDADDFMSLDEFTRYRQATSENLYGAYRKLMDTPKELLLGETPQIPNTSSIAYDIWVLQMYGPEIIKVFGSLEMVDEGSIPMGVINLLLSNKMKWKA